MFCEMFARLYKIFPEALFLSFLWGGKSSKALLVICLVRLQPISFYQKNLFIINVGLLLKGLTSTIAKRGSLFIEFVIPASAI